jgi:uncharacterized repeat protein (TIGR03806 family)
MQSRKIKTTLTLLPIFVALALLFGFALRPAEAALVNRWSFNNAAGTAPAGTTFADSIGGANAVVVGVGATLTGSALTLPGTDGTTQTSANVPANTIAAYVDLPNGIISSKTNLTVEIWAMTITPKKQQRLFDFGRMNIGGAGSGAAPGEITNDSTTAPGTTSASDDIDFIANLNTTISSQQLEARLNGGTTIKIATALATTANTEYHHVFVFTDGAGSYGAAGGQFSWYRNGAFAASIDLNFHLRDIEDVNNWLGRSQWTGDFNANIAFNEVRLYNHALTPLEITNSFLAGPNALPGPPGPQPDAVTMHHLQKARIPVLANDTGNINPATVTIATPPAFGSATPDSAGKILYAHTNGTPASDNFTYRVSGPGGTSAVATVTVNFSSSLGLTNNTLNVPATPPATAYQLAEAFPSLAFTQPTCLRTPLGETNRLFVCEKTGLLRVIPSLAAPSGSTFLNLPALLTSRGESISTSGENGLLGLAFHPGYSSNRLFYVFYSVNTNGATYQRISRFTAQAGNTNAADTASEVILISQVDAASNHNGGDLHFGPDGYLYISLGDGGSQNDTQGNAQKINASFFSAIARIDVDKKPGSLAPNAHASVILSNGVAAYAIPPGNPYIGATSFNGSAVAPSTVRTEFYAVGFRNPWRFSFDLVTSNLWVGDVGQDIYEEVNLVTNGGNYGWSYRDGPTTGPRAAPGGFTSVNPLYYYLHTGQSGDANFKGNSITGGLVYRGTRISELAGAYVFSDYVSGNIWTLRQTNAAVTVERIAGEVGIVAFGTDPANGDVLLADHDNNRILRLTAGGVPGNYPTNLSDTGLFADVTDLSPAPGVLPYEPNLPFWSDHALKRRWFVIPDATNKMTWSRDGWWTFPPNQIWVKHFDLETIRGNPATKKRLETRLLVRNSGGVYGVSYRWNDAQTDAALVPDEGVNFPFNVTNNGVPLVQTWRIPSRAECLACHTPQAGHALSFNTRQLNRPNTIHGFSGNQLELLSAAGYFANAPEPVNTLPRHVGPNDTAFPLETRVRSYLDVNCAYCHQPGGPGGGTWDGRAQTPLFAAGIINGAANANNGDPANKYVVPRDPLHSVIYNRAAATNGFTRMPPLATSELDQTNIALLAQWIATFDTNRLSFADWQILYFGATNAPNSRPGDDPDNDGRRNELEYLLGTLPLVANTNTDLTVSVSPSSVVTLNYSLSPNAIAQLQASTNLLNWSLWNVPGNDGLPLANNPQTLQGPATNPATYFRLRLNPR